MRHSETNNAENLTNGAGYGGSVMANWNDEEL